MKGNGHWVKLYSKLLHSVIWNDCPEAWLKVWIGLLLRATYWPTPTRKGDLPAGTCRGTLADFSESFRVSASTVRRAFAFLVDQRMISIAATNVETTVTVLNWESYQQGEEARDKPATNERQTSEQTKEQTTGQTEPRIRVLEVDVVDVVENSISPVATGGEFALTAPEPKAKPKRKADTNFTPEFEEWYSLYPRKESPHAAAKAYARHAAKVGHELLLSALRQQLPSLQERLEVRGDFRPHPASWLNSGQYLNAPVEVRPMQPKRQENSVSASLDRIARERFGGQL